MKIESITYIAAQNKRILAGLGFAALFLVIEAGVHVALLRENDNILAEIFSTDGHETLLRLLIVLLFVAFAALVQVSEKKLAAKGRELIEAGIEWERTFDAVPDFIAIVDTQYRIRRINKAMAKRLGLDQDRIIGSVCYRMVHGTETPPSYCPHAKLLADHEPHTAELHDEPFGGDYILTVSPLFDQNGCLIGCTHVARDISAQKCAEQALRTGNAALERQLRFTETLLKAEPIAVFFKDAEGRYLGCNEAFSKIVGMTPENIAGKTVFDLWPAELAEVYHRQDEELLRNPGHQVYESRLKNAGGELIDVIFNKDVFQDENGNVGGIIGTFLDISDRKRVEVKIRDMNEELELRVATRTAELEREISERVRTEKTLQESEERYRRITDAITDYIYSVQVENGKAKETSHGAGCLAVTGYTPGELAADRYLWIKMVAEEDREAVKEQTSRVLAGQEVPPIEHRILRKDGKQRWVRSTIVSRRDPHGALQSYDGLIQDITERKNAEEMLRNYTNSLRTLSARLMEARESERRHIAHELHDEIGQSLTGIKLSLDGLRRKGDPGLAAALSAVQEELNGLMERVRDLSLRLRPSHLDTLGLLPTLQWHFSRYAEQTGIAVDFRHDGPVRRLPMEIETVLYRVVQEALTNVARHADVEEVQVVLSLNDREAKVTVSDRGAGFDVNNVLQKGRTMGLNGMRERVDDLGGTLAIESAPCTGTHLAVSLPLVCRLQNE